MHEISRPPREVIGACVAITAGALIGCIMDRPGAQLAGRSFASDVLVIISITALIVWGLLWRQNWMRNLLCAWYLLGAFFALVVWTMKGLRATSLLLSLQVGVELLAAVLLLLPASRGWFANPAREKQKLSKTETIALWIVGAVVAFILALLVMVAISTRGAV